MLLVGSNGDRLELDVLGYQFLAVEDDEWDSSWLVIRVSAKNDSASWSATDSSLLTSEVETLADWLEALGEGRGVPKELDFTEPNLTFELIEEGQRESIRVWFELELRPGWARADEVPAHDLHVDLDTSSEDLRIAVESLRSHLRRFPPRARAS